MFKSIINGTADEEDALLFATQWQSNIASNQAKALLSKKILHLVQSGCIVKAIRETTEPQAVQENLKDSGDGMKRGLMMLK